MDIASQGRLRRHRSYRGQSLVEFALVLPMLLVLLLGLADFGRVFQAGITIEAAARNAAEAAAQEYLQLLRNKPGGVLEATDYSHLHDVALERVCAEAEILANHAVDLAGNCEMPVAAVCIHDGNDMAGCGVEADGSVPECAKLNAAGSWNDGNGGYVGGGPSTALQYVEVRVCYRFTTLFNLTDLRLPFGWNLTLGEVWLERDREFTVANY